MAEYDEISQILFVTSILKNRKSDLHGLEEKRPLSYIPQLSMVLKAALPHVGRYRKSAIRL